MIKVIIIVATLLPFFIIYPILKISSLMSRLEEKEEELWRQQEYGKSKKD